MWKELLPAPLSSGGHPGSGVQLWALECNRGQQRKVAERGLVTVEAGTTQFCLWWLRGLLGSLSGNEDNLSGRGPRKSSTCLKQTLGGFVAPQPKRTITKSSVYEPEFMSTEHCLDTNFYYHTRPEMQPPCWTEQLHVSFPSKIGSAMATFI